MHDPSRTLVPRFLFRRDRANLKTTEKTSSERRRAIELIGLRDRQL